MKKARKRQAERSRDSCLQAIEFLRRFWVKLFATSLMIPFSTKIPFLKIPCRFYCRACPTSSLKNR
jgi:hypothetical protein